MSPRGGGAPEFRSYYGRPIVKPSPWEADIPAYLFAGGLAAGSSLLAAGADLTGRPALRRSGRLGVLREAGVAGARLYGADESDGVGGFGAFFLLLDEPEVYGLPPDPVVTTRDLPRMWKAAAGAALGLVCAVAAACVRPR